jgi:hypothetical protein
MTRITFIFFLIASLSSFTFLNIYTVNQSPHFEYYIYISGVNERNDVLNLQASIQKKQGVEYFMAERFPVRCFVLKSNRSISQIEFSGWLPAKFTVVTFGEGDRARESAYKIYYQVKKSNHQR